MRVGFKRMAMALAALVTTGLVGCVRIPPGPNVMALPGRGKSFEAFQADDIACRDYAAYRTDPGARHAATDTAVANAAVGTVVGAATGAAIGAAAGNPAMGAAVGAGAGLLGGTAIGADQAERTRYTLQRRYDAAYTQCMYAKGNQVPLPRGSQPATGYGPPPAPPAHRYYDVPPPPAGRPPQPPPY